MIMIDHRSISRVSCSGSQGQVDIKSGLFSETKCLFEFGRVDGQTTQPVLACLLASRTTTSPKQFAVLDVGLGFLFRIYFYSI